MQNASTAHLGGNTGHNWNAPVPNLYQQNQQQPRSTSNPRSYPEQPGQEGRREDGQPTPVYDAGYGNYQQSGYGNVGYGGYGSNPVNYNSSPSTSRRTSGQQSKPASTPPTSAPPANTSPMYPSRSGDMVQQSPYQPASAPPNVNHHMPNQPQTAHPYGGGYYNYYDQGPWYPQGAVRPGQASTPTQPVDRHTPQTGGSYDYSASPYGWEQNRWQTPNSGRQGSGSAPSYYPQQPPQPYPWQPWQNQYYPPPASAQPNLPPTPSSGRKDKGRKSEEYQGLGKRSAEPTGPEDDKNKGKKGKKEDVKPPAPAKSHLHPPRQAQSAWQLFFTDELNKAKEAAIQGNSPGGTPQHAKLNVAQIAKDAGLAYANLNDEQKEYYAGKVQESKEQYAHELAVWQSTLTPEDIRAENAFRAQQRKEGKSRKGNLKDPNAPKKPLSAYFLFLKDIRENDDLRMKVWGDESETTKQSVLAAERWRSLSDDDKRPFLSQAETDKQEYEAARKIYEDEAAARARGEDVPARPVVVPEVPHVKLVPGKSHKKKSQPEPKPEPKLESSSPAIDITPNNVEPPVDFSGFSDLTGDMDLGFHDVAAPSHNGEDWGVHTIMGNESSSTPDVSDPVEPQTTADPAPAVVSEDVSEAPALDDSADSSAQETPMDEVRDVAAAAEGELAVPSQLPDVTPTDADPPAIPTEEVSEMPPVDPAPIESSDPVPTTPDATLTEDADKAFESAALGEIVAPEAVPDEDIPKTVEEVQMPGEEPVDAI